MAMQQCSNEEFLDNAVPFVVMIDGQPFMVEPRTYSSGSVGFCRAGKVNLMVNGQVLRFQLALNLVLIGSKPSDNDDTVDIARKIRPKK